MYISLIYQIYFKHMQISSSLSFFINIMRLQATVARKFDASLDGIGFNEFIILLYLNKSQDGKMRRVDLADKLGLTPSGVTRILLPMEKIGLIKKHASATDARVSFVSLAPGGKRKLLEAMERAELLTHDLIPQGKLKEIKLSLELLAGLAL